MTVTVGSLFSGIGGLDLGLERAGMKVLWQCEIDPFCRRVLRKHWPMTWIFNDVKTILQDPKFLALPKVDLICGGDPCQENSRARATGTCAAPSLGQDFIDIVRHLRPQFVLRENPSAVRKDAPWPWWRFRSELEEIGYGVLPFRLRSCCLGGEHRRDRVWVLARLPDPIKELPLRSGNKRFHDSDKAQGEKEQRVLSASERFPRRVAASRILRSAYELSDSVDRIKSLGNSVDVAQSSYIGAKLMEWIECTPP
jgi:DNA (cytosine-5)-methyltransferase 1